MQLATGTVTSRYARVKTDDTRFSINLATNYQIGGSWSISPYGSFEYRNAAVSAKVVERGGDTYIVFSRIHQDSVRANFGALLGYDLFSNVKVFAGGSVGMAGSFARLEAKGCDALNTDASTLECFGRRSLAKDTELGVEPIFKARVGTEIRLSDMGSLRFEVGYERDNLVAGYRLPTVSDRRPATILFSENDSVSLGAKLRLAF